MGRGRVRTLCSFCRKRKIKCDMATPCLACVRYRKYGCDVGSTAEPAAVAKKTFAEMDYLKERFSALEAMLVKQEAMLIKQEALLEGSLASLAPEHAESRGLPERRLPEYADFSFGEAVRPTNFRGALSLRQLGPLRWISLLGLDKGIYRVLTYVKPWIKGLKKDPSSPGPHSPCANRGVTVQLSGPSTGLAMAVGNIETTHMDEAQLLRHIEAFLPDRRAVWKLVDRFFAVVYPHVPILDELEFRGALVGLIGAQEAYGQPFLANLPSERIELHSTDKLALAMLGQLLLVMRLAHLSLFTASHTLSTSYLFNTPEEVAWLVLLDVGVQYVAAAEGCLRQFDLTQDSFVEVIQLLLLLRIYVLLAPETSVPDSKNYTFSAVIVLMANMRSLNRDPAHIFTGDSLSYRKRMLLRKLWYIIVDLDVFNSANTGNALMINPDSYDVETPMFMASTLNVKDHFLDHAVCDRFVDSVTMRNLLVDGIKLTGTMRPVRVREVLAMVERVETMELHYWNEIQTSKDTPPISSVAVYQRTTVFLQWCEVYYFALGVNIHVYYYYLRKGDLDQTDVFRMKILEYICGHMTPFLPLLLDEDKSPFSSTTDFITIPIYFNSIVQALNVSWAMYIDYRLHMLYMERHPEMSFECTVADLNAACDLIQNLMDVLSRGLEQTRERFKFLAKVYSAHEKLAQVSNMQKLFEDDELREPPRALFLEALGAVITSCLEQPDVAKFFNGPETTALKNAFADFEPDFNAISFQEFVDFMDF